MGAMLFLISASALTIAVIYDAVSNKSQSPKTNTAQQASCNIQVPVPAPAEKLPANYQKKDTATDSLKSRDIQLGSGAAATNGDCLYMKYYGTLAKDGTLFDENYDKATALQFTLGASEVIPGWDVGLVGMKVGGVRRLVIPGALAYPNGQGNIPANATLVFLVKLVAIK